MTVFQTPEYRAVYAKLFGAGKRFHAIETEHNGLYLQTRGLGVRRLEFWAQGIADCGGAQIENPTALGDLWDSLGKLSRLRAGAVLAQIAATSPLIECARADGWAVTPAEVCPVLALPDSYDDYVKSLGKNMREQIKRYPRRLEKQFSVEYELAQTPQQVDEFWNQLVELHGRRWRARGQTGVLALPSRRNFHRYICHKFLANDWLRLWRLKCDGRPACVLLSYFWGGKYWFFIGGFEPELMRWSVGTCLFSHVFRHAIAEGAGEFDFLRGAEEYKYRFGAVDRDYVDLKWFSGAPKGALLRRRVGIEDAFMRRLHEKFSAAHQ